jgi:hypothetical protein
MIPLHYYWQAGGVPLKTPKISNSVCVPTNTKPLATVGTAYLDAAPALSLVGHVVLL